MKTEDRQLELKAIEERFLSDAIDGNRFLDLMEILQNSPDEFWEAYFDDPNSPIRDEAKLLLAKLGPDATFADLKAVLLEKDVSKTNTLRTRSRKTRNTNPRQRRYDNR